MKLESNASIAQTDPMTEDPDTKDAQIAALQRQVAELQAQLKIYTDFCSCL